MNVTYSERRYRNKIHPKKFALYAGCASITMMFAAFTSAYIVRMGAGNWLEFPLPMPFYYSTAVIVLSSICIHFSYKSFISGKKSMYRLLLTLSCILGFAFVYLQYQGWLGMTAMGVELTGNPSGSFIYVISGLHAAHVLGGISAIIVAMVHAFVLEYKPSAKRKLRFEMTCTYWHYVDVLWVYLFLFFLFFR